MSASDDSVVSQRENRQFKIEYKALLDEAIKQYDKHK